MRFRSKSDGRRKGLSREHVRAVQFLRNHTVEQDYPIRLSFQCDREEFVFEVTQFLGDHQRSAIRQLDEFQLNFEFFRFMTALSESDDMRRGMNLGADDSLTKPVTREALLETIRVRLERHEARQTDSGTLKGFRPDFSSPQTFIDKLGLTPREAEVLLWVSQGKSNGDIAVILGMAEKTVKKHMTHIFDKLGIEGRSAAMFTGLEALS